jgi:hypothetical protein
MFLKLMGNENLHDHHSAKSFKIVANIDELKFSINECTNESLLQVHYSIPNRGLTEELFVLSANAYLMNSEGKTIQSFAASNFEVK